MAGNAANIKEELEMSLAEDSVPGGHSQSQEHIAITEMIERGPWSPGVSQRRQKLESKVAAAQQQWTMSRIKKTGHQSQLPRMQRDQSHGEMHAQETSGNVQSMRYNYDRSNPGTGLLAEIGLDELNGLEMEVIRRQMQVITARLRVLEDQDASWRYKETLLFTLLVSACIVNLWLWMRQ
ncbi:fetal and adult testis-expressed transcript protein [Thomomys bottae]